MTRRTCRVYGARVTRMPRPRLALALAVAVVVRAAVEPARRSLRRMPRSVGRTRAGAWPALLARRRCRDTRDRHEREQEEEPVEDPELLAEEADERRADEER